MKIPLQLRRKSISNNFKGLLEVEPIQYTCCSTSEATRIENIDSVSVIQSTNIIDDILTDAPSNTCFIKLPHDSKDAKKSSEIDMDKYEIGMSNNVHKILVDKIFMSQLKKHKFKDDIKSCEKGNKIVLL